MGPAVGESGLDEDPGHEAKGAGSASLLGFDLECFLSELLGLGATLSGTGVPNGPLQDLPEAMRTVVSTRQGGTPYAAKLMSLSELKDSSWAKTVFQISPVGDAMQTTVSIVISEFHRPSSPRKWLFSSDL